MKEGWLVWGRGLGYLSIVCTPWSRRVFNSTPRTGLGFLRDSNIQQLSVRVHSSVLTSTAMNEGVWWKLYLNHKPLLFLMLAPLTAFSVQSTFSPTGHVYLDQQSTSLLVSSLKQQQNGSAQSHDANWNVSEWEVLTWSAFPDWAAALVESSPLLEYAGMQTPPACQCLTKIMSLWKFNIQHKKTDKVTTK